MTEHQNIELEQELRQLVGLLLLNGTLTNCQGLVHGKIGIAIFFFHYARYSGNMLFADYAMDLIGKTLEQIHAMSRADYEKGIAGIGVGIDYMIRQDFLDPDGEIFEDFDERMYRAVMHEPCLYLGFYDGLCGYGEYWIVRSIDPSASALAKECLENIIHRIEHVDNELVDEELVDICRFLRGLRQAGIVNVNPAFMDKLEVDCRSKFQNGLGMLNLSSVDQLSKYYLRKVCLEHVIPEQVEVNEKTLLDLRIKDWPTNMGLRFGCAGEGLWRLSLLQKSDFSWLSLL